MTAWEQIIDIIDYVTANIGEKPTWVYITPRLYDKMLYETRMLEQRGLLIADLNESNVVDLRPKIGGVTIVCDRRKTILHSPYAKK